nr:retrotransposon protein, putative, Ty1-copia subclass [Tanacetum cinerariifolium]
MAHHVQNINHSAFRLMFEREKLSGNNFNDWFRQLKLVLRVEKKMYVIEQPLAVAPAADSATNVLAEWNALYDAYNRLIEYEKGLPKKAETPQVMMIKGGKIHKANKNSLKAKSKGKAKGNGKDKQVYIPKPKNPKPVTKEHQLRMAPATTTRINGIYDIDMHDLVPNVNSIYSVSTKRAKHNLDSTYLWHCRLAHISKKRIEKLQQEGLLKSIDDESFNQCVSCLSGKLTRKSFPHRPERATDLFGIIHTHVCGPLRHVSKQGASYFITFTDDYSRYGYVYLLKHKHELTPPYTPQYNSVFERRNHTLLDMVRPMMYLTTLPLSFWDYALEFTSRILNMVLTKNVDKTPYELWYGKVPTLSYLKVWGCEALVKRDTPDKLQQRSVKCIFIGYPKEIKGYYFYFPPENKIVVTVGSKWIFKKNTDMDGIVHTYKTRLVAKGYTQLYGVDYVETFSHVTDIRAFRILISIAAYHDYKIWKMDVKIAFLNGYLDEDIYM